MRGATLQALGIVSAGTAAALALTGCSGTSARMPRMPGSAACGTLSGRGCAPARKRVDLVRPSFSSSTDITNPLCPISRLRSALFLGRVDGKPFRTETTLLPGTRAVDWGGPLVRVLVSQYMAYLDGRLQEVALDRYAQADDGSVWYFGEDVFDYANGTVATTEGTWLAGREGPPAMIMPAHPRLGDVFRTENAPPIVFEEVRVRSVGGTVPGPLGRIKGAMVGEELHSDGTHEDKIFAPGYGEFRTAGGGDVEALALAVPTNSLGGQIPPPLHSLLTNAEGLFDLVQARNWRSAEVVLRHIEAGWARLRGRRTPVLVSRRMRTEIRALSKAVRNRRPRLSRQSALDVAQSALDLELLYRPPVEIDRQRFVLWTRQLQLDAASGSVAGVTGDVATLEWIRDRIAQALDPAGRHEIDTRLRDLRGAADARNLGAAADHAARVAARLRTLAG